MMYETAPEVEAIAAEVIAEHLEELHELIAADHLKIAYLWRPQAQSMGEGRVVGGCCVKVDDRNHALHGFDFMIVIAKDVWNDVPRTEFRRALVHHELLHVGVRYDADGAVKFDEESGRLVTYCRHHNIEEFEEILGTYGAWHEELRRFLAAHNREKEET